jgi:hypothetical protein
MDDKLRFVQFIHPGGEHKPDHGSIKEWNRSAHRRKFLKQPGRYVSEGRIIESEILFWGEWEPESEVQKIDNPIDKGPHFIHEPYYILPESYQGLQNTDPFVFGQVFHYTGCQQRTIVGPTQLRYLSRGSVILFGSCEDRDAFVLDTVFVVDHWIEHSRASHSGVLAGAISHEYDEVAISPWYQEPLASSKSCSPAGSQETWRLYFGVTFEKPLEGMYSFFPCRPYETKCRGFARPRISLPGAITNTLNQGKKLTEQSNLDRLKLLWSKVVEQVQERGLVLGVYAEMPERRPRTNGPATAELVKGVERHNFIKDRISSSESHGRRRCTM